MVMKSYFLSRCSIALVCMFLTTWSVGQKKEISEPLMFRTSSVDFSAWVENILFHQNILFTTNQMQEDLLLGGLIYLDSVKQDVNVPLRFMVNKKGNVEDVNVEKISDEAFANELKRIVELSPKWRPARVDGKKVDEEVEMVMDFSLIGRVAFLDKGPVWAKDWHLNYSKGLSMNRYLSAVEGSVNAFQRKYRNDLMDKKKVKTGGYALSGKLEVSFIIHKDGTLSDFWSKQNLSPIYYDLFLKAHTSGRGLFSPGMKWVPAELNGKPVSVKVIASFDYDKRIYGWTYWLVDE